MDEVTELADLMTEHQRRGEELDHLEFRLRWASLTDEERDRFFALMNQRLAHRMEKLEALQEEDRLLKILLRLDVGLITPLQAVHQIRGAVPDPLARQ
jgi:hypothetical protein